ncbi:MAG: PQQ-binding-like beta-propeller repeat protein [Thermoplasmata archaeon]|nr:PQQ-binding-like beta-propeller repeat protein [Thermoplasmata archaeon]
MERREGKEGNALGGRCRGGYVMENDNTLGRRTWRAKLPAVILVLLLLPAAVLHGTVGQTSNGPGDGTAGEREDVRVCIDMGDGRVFWADITLEEVNTSAFNATERACGSLGLFLGASWSEWGAFVYQIGDMASPPDWSWWWSFYVWNDSGVGDDVGDGAGGGEGFWEMSMVGASSLNLSDGDAILWTPSNHRPLATPDHPFPYTGFRGNLRNTGRVFSPAPTSNDPLWAYDTGSYEVDSTPAGAGGMIFLNTWTGFAAVYDNGTTAWWRPEVRGMSSPAICGDLVVAGSTNGTVYALYRSNGSICWTADINLSPVYSGITSSPAISDGAVYIGVFNESGGNGGLCKLDASTGQIVWHLDNISSVHLSKPAVSDGRVYVGEMGLFNSTAFSYEPPYGLLCVNESDGSLLWRFSTGGPVASSPAVAGNKVFFSSKDGRLYAISLEGAEMWNRSIGASISSPAVADGRVYVGSGGFDSEGRLWCFDLNGSLLWNLTTTGGIQSSPLVADGMVFFATNEANGTIYSLSTDGEEVWRYTPEPRQYILSSPALVDGRLYIASDNGMLYCFAGDVPPTVSFTVSSGESLLEGPEGLDVVDVVAGSEVFFNASNSTDASGPLLSVAWDFGDGTTAHGLVVSHVYSEPGEYNVTLEMADDEGNTYQYTFPVRVDEASKAGGGGLSFLWPYVGAAAVIFLGAAAVYLIRKRGRKGE